MAARAPSDAAVAVAAARAPNVIYEGDTVICQTSDGRMFFQEMKKDQCVPLLYVFVERAHQWRL